MHVVVIGSGLAGLSVALSLPTNIRVTVVSKGTLGEGNSAWAQGGIAAALGADDSAQLHARDTLDAGVGLCDVKAVRHMTEHGPDAINALQNWGVHFDGPTAEKPTLAREAAHSVNRIVHVGGDATGAGVMTALATRVRERMARDGSGAAPFVLREQTAVSRLRMSGGRVVGVDAVNRDGQREVFHTDAVVLATGGAGQLFAHTSNPMGATADGIALAADAGAQLADLEFVQFHPTTLAGAGGFLISEAVRGEGAVLLTEDGHRFMPSRHPLAELAPRDVVASTIAEVMAQQDGRPVLLDASGLGATRLAQRFPTIDAATRAAGFNWSSLPIPVTPAAHYLMGGVVTDRFGRSTVPGLWAVGEVARTGVHGANRLASNSLLEAVVFARSAAVDIASRTQPSVPTADEAVQNPIPTNIPSSPSLTRLELQQIMWRHAGLHRDGAGLALAEQRLRVATLVHRENADPVEVLEDRALHTTALAVVRAAAAREHSIGSHRRSDEAPTRKLSA